MNMSHRCRRSSEYWCLQKGPGRPSGFVQISSTAYLASAEGASWRCISWLFREGEVWGNRPETQKKWMKLLGSWFDYRLLSSLCYLIKFYLILLIFDLTAVWRIYFLILGSEWWLKYASRVPVPMIKLYYIIILFIYDYTCAFIWLRSLSVGNPIPLFSDNAYLYIHIRIIIINSTKIN